MAQKVDREKANLFLKPRDVHLCMLLVFHIFEIGVLLELVQRHRVSATMVMLQLVLAKSLMVAMPLVLLEFDATSFTIVGAISLIRFEE